MEKLVSQWAHNPKIAGSSPAPATKLTEELKKNLGNKESENRYECFTVVNGTVTQACIGYDR